MHLNIFNEDFKDFLLALNTEKVKYLLVGGYAVILHGYNRTTGDLDIWVERTEENFNRLVAAFKHFGLPTNAISLISFLNDSEKDVFTFGRPPVAIDILTNLKGVKFDEAWSLSEIIQIEGIEFHIIHINHLIQAKKAAGRHKDLDDLENLSSINQ